MAVRQVSNPRLSAVNQMDRQSLCGDSDVRCAQLSSRHAWKTLCVGFEAPTTVPSNKGSVARSRNHICNGNAMVGSLCVVQLHITVSNRPV
jgi:hypothetical protein